MTFRPVNPRNAVLEAVVFLHFNRPVFAPEAAAVRALHPRLAHDLPRLDEVQVATIAFGPGPPSAPLGAPISMAAFKKDANLETRVFLNGALLAVNFLLYTQWDELWPKAAGWIRMVLAALRETGGGDGIPPLQVAIVGHQMINVFIWEGANDGVTVKDLFAEKPVRLADAAWEVTGQAWFAMHSTNQPLDAKGKQSALVDSLSFDLAEERGVGWRLRLEQTLEARFAQPVGTETLAEAGPEGGPTLVDALLDRIHNKTRCLMRSILRQDMLRRIGMEAL